MTENVVASTVQENWVFFVVIVALYLMAVSWYFFRSRVFQLIGALFGDRYFHQMEREGNCFDEAVCYMLYMNYVLTLSLLIWHTGYFLFEENPIPAIPSAIMFLLVAGALVLLVLFKGVLMQIIAWVFHTRRATLSYLRNLMVFNQFTGMVLFPVVVFAVYTPGHLALMVAWGIFILSHFLRVLRGGVIGMSGSGLSAYYLFLYLCTIEVAPALILVRAVSGWVPLV